jgi:type I restriction enzyme, S subunit
MSFPAYEEYRDSKVEWISEVPAHWGDPKKLKTVSSLKGRLGWQGLKADEYVGQGPYVVSSAHFESFQIQWGQCPHVSDDRYELDDNIQLATGDILLMKDGAAMGKLAFVDHLPDRACLNSHLLLFRPLTIGGEHTYHPRFLFYFMQTDLFQEFVRVNGTGATFLGISQASIGNYRISLPTLAEQYGIAAFLDRETAKIDGLVAEQRRLIALLQEKRQALISHAVTKGLDPTAPLKPTGIDWLGDVPAHWDVLPIKRIVATRVTDGPHETPEFCDEGIPFVSAEAVSSGRIDFSRIRGFISPKDNERYSQKYSPKLYDIYMVKSGATTGVTAIVDERVDFNIWSPLAAIRCGEKVMPRFLLNFLRSRNFQEAITLNWSFGTQQNIGMGVIENLACTVPPIHEQAEIATQIDTTTEQFDLLEGEAQRAIDLLQERRTALISAAVTGKIDVRGLTTTEAVA